jgi:hypothetical protein
MVSEPWLRAEAVRPLDESVVIHETVVRYVAD